MSEPVWRGQWIWSAADGPANTWMCFRKSLGLARRPKTAVARIAADTKYWLWVNGDLVVREGGLKRGPTPEDTYYDVIDLASFLRRGENVVAVLVWYWGKHGFSHKDSGRGGLVFDSDVLVSDGTWRCREHPAFKRSKAAVQRQLALWPVWYDARRAPAGWQQPEFDDADWSAATAKGVPPTAPWGRLVRRPVPFWRHRGLRPYANARDLPRRVRLEKGRAATATAHLPCNGQMTPYLRIDAPAGTVVTIDTDCSRRGKLWARYVCRGGVQAWESPAWLNGERVRYRFRGATGTVRILALKYRQSGIDAEFAGSFTCDDPALEVLWRKAARTTYLCIRDNYMDCPDRERAQWWGDAVNEILQTFYCLDRRADASIRKGILEIANWQRPDGVLYSPVPQGSWGRELPTQMLAGTWVMWQYYQHTGDAETMRAVYPAIRRYIAAWEGRRDGQGLVEPRGEWLWFDWGAEPKDGYRMTNALYVLVLRSAAGMADLAGERADAERYRAMAEAHAALSRARLWDGAAYGEDERANALFTLAGLVDGRRAPGVVEILSKTRRCSPYLERYVLEALYQLGRPDLAVERMKARYGPMIRSRWTTLWEEFPRKGTPNHAWAGGPLYVLSAYAAGVRPTRPGYAAYCVEPQMGPLARVSVEVATVRGRIAVGLKRRVDGLRVGLVSPADTVARVVLPPEVAAGSSVTVNGRPVWRDGHAVGRVVGLQVEAGEGGRPALILPPGTYAIDAWSAMSPTERAPVPSP